MRIYLNDDWEFSPSFSPALLHGEAKDMELQTVRLPHTTVETPLHYFDESMYQKISCYRRRITPKKEWEGKRILLTVEAVGHLAEVFLNGEKIGEHRCGYTAFTVDLAPSMFWDKENLLAITVDSRESLNIPPFGNVIDYMTYGGIYREVYLEIKEDNYFVNVFPKAKDIRIKGEKASALLEAEVILHHDESGMQIKQTLFDNQGNLVADFPMGEKVHILEEIDLWSLDNPKLYTVKTQLWRGNDLLDESVDRIGFRKAVFLEDGFYLNDKKVKIRGLNRHQSYPYVGYAMPESMQRYDAEILKKELGVNAVRTSHYPQSHYFLDSCDELGLLVFTEIPGWQHIGDEAWQEQAILNTKEMVMQYRNHPSIILWGVRINESMDNDEFYKKTNEVAHSLDETRQTSGVRFIQKSSLLEDVYAYNDFSHDGSNAGCVSKKKSTPNGKRGYLISEYNGHMFPTKSFDSEDHRVEHLMRHARVMNDYYKQEDIAGGFGWCMFDYNTHKDFGSGDRICYHGVMDMFRNKKLAAQLYAAQEESGKDCVLEISSAMDIGEHPACLMKDVYAVTNADSLRVYKNDVFIKEYAKTQTPFKSLPHGPILVQDFIGDMIEKGEGFSHGKAEDIKKILVAANKYGLAHLPFSTLLLAAKCILFRKMKMQDAVELYNKYVGNWGGTATVYRFEAIKDGKVEAAVQKKPMTQVVLEVEVSSDKLQEKSTYDVASIRMRACSENGTLLNFYNDAVSLEVEGDIELIGPKMIALQGGMGGTYVRSLGKSGKGTLKICGNDFATIKIEFGVETKIEEDSL